MAFAEADILLPVKSGESAVPSADIEVFVRSGCPHCAKAFGSTFGLEGHVVKSHQSLPVSAKEYPGVIKRPARSMNKSEAVAFVKHIRPEYSEDVCTRLIDFILDHPED
jgi:uncharacterized C2H2 Zn-finger protein